MKGKLPMLSLFKQEGVVFDPWKVLTLVRRYPASEPARFDTARTA
jgi:hypothetical protein